MATTQAISNPTEEANWLRAIANGDRSAFRKLHQRFKGVLFVTIYKVLNDHAEAEDTLQEVFAQIWQKAHLFQEGKGKPLTWAAALARNRAIDHLRSKQRRSRLYSEFETRERGERQTVGTETENAAYGNEVSDILHGAVMELSPGQRKAIELAFFSGLTQREVAGELGEPLGTVKARIRRGVQKLRRKVAPRL